MHLRVKLFATLAALAPVKGLPGTPFELDLPDGSCLEDLVRRLRLPDDQVKITFVNGIIQSLDWPLSDGDDVGIFPPVGGGSDMNEMTIDTWLYGPLARFGGDPDQASFANPQVILPIGSTVSNLLAALKMPTEERGITFINGDLSAMPGLQPDLDHELHDRDRVAFFHLRSMWPFQYRHGVAMTDEMSGAMQESKDAGLHHTYTE